LQGHLRCVLHWQKRLRLGECRGMVHSSAGGGDVRERGTLRMRCAFACRGRDSRMWVGIRDCVGVGEWAKALAKGGSHPRMGIGFCERIWVAAKRRKVASPRRVTDGLRAQRSAPDTILPVGGLSERPTSPSISCAFLSSNSILLPTRSKRPPTASPGHGRFAPGRGCPTAPQAVIGPSGASPCSSR
jgi:hypothetical protein